MHPTNFSHSQLAIAEGYAFDAIKAIAPILNENFGATPHTKNRDEWAEEELIRQLGAFSADVGTLGRESGAQGDTNVYWTIDSIKQASVAGEGTLDTMIALVDEGQQPVLGVVQNARQGVLYHAMTCDRAYLREGRKDTEMHISSTRVSEATIAASVEQDTEVGDDIISGLERAGATVPRIARAGHMLVAVASGVIEGLVAINGEPWECAPGALLVRVAGGVVDNFEGKEKPYRVGDFGLIASNQSTFPAIIDSVKRVHAAV